MKAEPKFMQSTSVLVQIQSSFNKATEDPYLFSFFSIQLFMDCYQWFHLAPFRGEVM